MNRALVEAKRLVFSRNAKKRGPSTGAKHASQMRIFHQFAAYDIGREYAGTSVQLDSHPVLFVAEDLGPRRPPVIADWPPSRRRAVRCAHNTVSWVTRH